MPDPPYEPVALSGTYDPRVLAARVADPVPPGRNRPAAAHVQRRGGRGFESGPGGLRLGLGLLVGVVAVGLVAALVLADE